MYEHMTRFSLAPMYDGFSVFVGSYLCVGGVSVPAYGRAGVCCHVNVWRDSSVQGCVRGVRGRAPNRGGINEDNMSHIFGSGAGDRK